MTVLTRWNPAGNLAAYEIDRLNRMFDHIFTGEPLDGGWSPVVDIYENVNQDIVLKAELPGFTREAIKVTFDHNTLTLEGERPREAGIPAEKIFRTERQFGAFRRSFTLAPSVDSTKAQASYADGVLTVTLPRREETKPRQIQVNA